MHLPGLVLWLKFTSGNFSTNVQNKAAKDFKNYTEKGKQFGLARQLELIFIQCSFALVSFSDFDDALTKNYLTYLCCAPMTMPPTAR
jgi:hypothetical protein